jgi:NAD(P)-dependent dehydrogenase (short-subunit alcohol dehydrogenase family)
MLGEAGATVYCSGRSVRGRPATEGRAETIEETADLVTAAGGTGIAVRTDHSRAEEVEALFALVQREQGRLDVLVNDIWGGDELTEWQPFWTLDPTKGFAMLDSAVRTHILTSRYGVPRMVERRTGLVVEITDGHVMGYRGTLFYDLAKMAAIRLAYDMALELEPHGVTALAVTPGFLRSEAMLDRFGVTEANWRDACAKVKGFEASETPCYVGRAVAALAADPDVGRFSGRALASWTLAKLYGFTDLDGCQPDWDAYFDGIVHDAIARGGELTAEGRYWVEARYLQLLPDPEQRDYVSRMAAALGRLPERVR